MRVSPVAPVDAFGFRASLAPTTAAAVVAETPAAAAAASAATAAGVNFNLLPAQGCCLRCLSGSLFVAFDFWLWTERKLRVILLKVENVKKPLK